MHLPLAFSIHHFISSVGADAGFAAIIGLAILVLLYFAQARETTTLRDEAIAASQRVEHLERRVAQLGSPPVAPPPGTAASHPAGAAEAAARPAAARLASPAVSAAAPQRPLPAAPAGVGAPALFDATRLIPAPTGPVAQTSPAQAPASGRRAQAPDKQPPGQGQQPAAAQRPQAAPKPVGATALATPPPATAAAGGSPPPPIAAAGDSPPPPIAADGPSSGTTGPSSPETASQPLPAGANGAGQQASASPSSGNRLPPRLQVRPDSPPLARWFSAGGRRPTRRLPALLGLLLLAAVVAVLLVVTSTGGGTQHGNATHSTNAPSSATRARASFTPASVTVAVLNGTNVSQLAHRVAQKLARAGYRQAAVATAADQTHTSTIVGFLPGFRRDAAHVATALSLPAGAIRLADQGALAIACPPPAACGANVIVTVGSDLTNSR